MVLICYRVHLVYLHNNHSCSFYRSIDRSLSLYIYIYNIYSLYIYIYIYIYIYRERDLFLHFYPLYLHICLFISFFLTLVFSSASFHRLPCLRLPLRLSLLFSFSLSPPPSLSLSCSFSFFSISLVFFHSLYFSLPVYSYLSFTLSLILSHTISTIRFAFPLFSLFSFISFSLAPRASSQF